MKSQQTGYAWHIAKPKFVTIYSTVMLAEKSLSWSSIPHIGAIFYHYALLDTQVRSEHSQAYIVLEASLEIAKGSRHTSA